MVESNSLSSLSDANIYFAALLYSQDWTSANSDKQQQALNQATQIIDGFQYIGFKTVSDQLHEWPRNDIRLGCLDVSGLPIAILNAQYEISRALLRGIDPERDIRGLRVTSRGYSSVRTTYDPRYVPEHLMQGVPSALAWSYLSTYLVRGDSGVVKLHRVT